MSPDKLGLVSVKTPTETLSRGHRRGADVHLEMNKLGAAVVNLAMLLTHNWAWMVFGAQAIVVGLWLLCGQGWQVGTLVALQNRQRCCRLARRRCSY